MQSISYQSNSISIPILYTTTNQRIKTKKHLFQNFLVVSWYYCDDVYIPESLLFLFFPTLTYTHAHICKLLLSVNAIQTQYNKHRIQISPPTTMMCYLITDHKKKKTNWLLYVVIPSSYPNKSRNILLFDFFPFILPLRLAQLLLSEEGKESSTNDKLCQQTHPEPRLLNTWINTHGEIWEHISRTNIIGCKCSRTHGGN